jgi:hypothetical protein
MSLILSSEYLGVLQLSLNIILADSLSFYYYNPLSSNNLYLFLLAHEAYSGP